MLMACTREAGGTATVSRNLLSHSKAKRELVLLLCLSVCVRAHVHMGKSNRQADMG